MSLRLFSVRLSVLFFGSVFSTRFGLNNIFISFTLMIVVSFKQLIHKMCRTRSTEPAHLLLALFPVLGKNAQSIPRRPSNPAGQECSLVSRTFIVALLAFFVFLMVRNYSYSSIQRFSNFFQRVNSWDMMTIL